MSLLRKTKRSYYAQLDNIIVADNRKFWKAASPLFSKEVFHKESIILKEHGKTITDNKKLLKHLTISLLKLSKKLTVDLSDIASQKNNVDPVFRAIEKYVNHPSILKIKRKMSDKGLVFSFKYVI